MSTIMTAIVTSRRHVGFTMCSYRCPRIIPGSALILIDIISTTISFLQLAMSENNGMYMIVPIDRNILYFDPCTITNYKAFNT